MELEENRLASFFNRQDGLSWPHTEQSHPFCTPKILASAGFFFSDQNINNNNVRDMCQCHYCGIRLRDWEATDKPWDEHKKHKPDCPFVLENTSNDSSIGPLDLFGNSETTTSINSSQQQSLSKDTVTTTTPIIVSDEMKLRGQFVSDLLFSLVNPQNDWNFDMEFNDLSPKSFIIPQITSTTTTGSTETNV